jgi:macrodomain Ter protein organizer (MatP/YcbG family)
MEAEHFIHIQKIEAETEEWKVVYILAHENDCDSIERFIELNEKGEIDIE